jgi:signal transduction histidine kinase/CheY-like chemotaxis protein
MNGILGVYSMFVNLGFKSAVDVGAAAFWWKLDIVSQFCGSFGAMIFLLVAYGEEFVKKKSVIFFLFFSGTVILCVDLFYIFTIGHPVSTGHPVSAIWGGGWSYSFLDGFDFLSANLAVLLTTAASMSFFKVRRSLGNKHEQVVLLSVLWLVIIALLVVDGFVWFPLQDISLLALNVGVGVAIWKYGLFPLRELKDQLFHSQKMEALGTLSAGIAHDINNILGGISMMADNMRISLDEPPVEVADILASCDRGKELTSNVLGYAGKRRFKKVVFDFSEIVERVHVILGRTVSNNIEIRMSSDRGPYYVNADMAQIEQVLMNVCVNSVDAMPDGGEIDFAVFKDEKRVTVRISDTGCGMSEDVMEKVFDPFFTTKSMADGTGLGLSVAWGVISDHGGKIEMKSDLRRGTAVDISLPIVDGDNVERRDTEGLDGVSWGDWMALIVDDESLILSAMKRLLCTMHMQSFTAENGAEAISVYRENRDKIGVIIMDQIMPGMTGLETIKKLEEIDPHVRGKVIMCSGYTNADIPDDLQYVPKPMKIQDLVIKITRILKSQSGGVKCFK